MGKILVGTCGYSYTEWVGPVYPQGTRAEDYLRLYAQKFSTVELDYTYYTQPKAAGLEKMLAAGGPDLSFAIKAHQSLTHNVEPATWEAGAKTYLEAITPVLRENRLEAVLFQFPYSFHYNPEQRRYLDKVLTFFRDVPCAVEFRNAEWLNSRVIEALKKRNMALVSLDMPNIKGLPSTLDVVTSGLAYIRLHGRNSEKWWGSDSAARYDYLYKDPELEAWAERIKRIAVKADKVRVYFNNHRRGQAVKNGETLTQILRNEGMA